MSQLHSRELTVIRMLLPGHTLADMQVTASHLWYCCTAGSMPGEPSWTFKATEQPHAAHLGALASGAYWPAQQRAILSFLQKPLKGLLKLLIIILQTGMQASVGLQTSVSWTWCGRA